jgi:hypothetical protein
MARNEKTAPINGKGDDVKEPDPAVTKLVLSLGFYVRAEDVSLDRVEFLRSVAARILEDLGI